MSDKFVSRWHGPFSIVPTETLPWIIEDSNALLPGVYLWTARVADAYLVNYIGMTTNSVATRTMEHLSKSFGTNVVDDPASFRTGSRASPLFHPRQHDWAEVRDRILPGLIEYLKEIRLFFVPIEVEHLPDRGRAVLERVESALIQQVRAYQATNPPLDFLSNKSRSRVETAGIREIEVEIDCSWLDGPLLGVETRFVA